MLFVVRCSSCVVVCNVLSVGFCDFCLLLVVRCSFFVGCCMMFVGGNSLFDVRCSRFWCLLVAICCSSLLLVVRYLWFVGCCSLWFVVRRSLFAVCCL